MSIARIFQHRRLDEMKNADVDAKGNRSAATKVYRNTEAVNKNH